MHKALFILGTFIQLKPQKTPIYSKFDQTLLTVSVFPYLPCYVDNIG